MLKGMKNTASPKAGPDYETPSPMLHLRNKVFFMIELKWKLLVRYTKANAQKKSLYLLLIGV